MGPVDGRQTRFAFGTTVDFVVVLILQIKSEDEGDKNSISI